MNDRDKSEIPVIQPRDPAEAAALFSGYSSRKKEGEKISVRLLDSPFETGEDSGCGDFTAAVSSAGMDRIEEVSARDLLAVCGGGVRLRDLRTEVEREDLFFPFDPGIASSDATLAQLIMGGAVWRYEGRYGRLREYILSMRLVTGTGNVINTGTRSVKNVAGYEIAGLATGGGSRCGLLCSVSLRLLPAPERVSVAVIPGECGRLIEEAPHHIKPETASVEIFYGCSARTLLGGDASRMGVPDGRGGGLILLESHGEGGGESDLLLEMRRTLADRLAAEAPLDYIAMDLQGAVPRGLPPCDGWYSLRPNRQVILGEREAGAGGTNDENDTIESLAREKIHPGGRIAAGTIGRMAGRPLVRRSRHRGAVPGQDLAPSPRAGEAGGPRDMDGISRRLDDLFDPEHIFARDQG